MKKILATLLICAATIPVAAQTDFNSLNEDGDFRPASSRNLSPDSLGSNQKIPKGIKVWTVDEKFGDRQEATVDTLQHMYMNSGRVQYLGQHGFSTHRAHLH